MRFRKTKVPTFGVDEPPALGTHLALVCRGSPEIPMNILPGGIAKLAPVGVAEKDSCIADVKLVTAVGTHWSAGILDEPHV